MFGACLDRNTRCGLRRFIRSFGIVQSASLQLISLHVALVSSLHRCRAGDVMRVPRHKAPWTWVHDGQNCSVRSEEHTSELQSLMRISYAVFCLKKKKHKLVHTIDLQ